MRKNAAYETMAAAAADPAIYIATWRERHPGQKVAAVLPMNFRPNCWPLSGCFPSSCRRAVVTTVRGARCSRSSTAVTPATWLSSGR